MSWIDSNCTAVLLSVCVSAVKSSVFSQPWQCSVSWKAIMEVALVSAAEVKCCSRVCACGV